MWGDARRATRFAIVAALLFSACSDDDGMADSGTPDAGPDGRVPLVLAPPMAPAPPAPPSDPVLTPCVGGFVEAFDDRHGLAVCEPWADAVVGCMADEVRLPGDATCRPVGDDCPSSGWATDRLPVGVTTIFVDELASGPGTGTVADPYPTIGRAISDATTKSIVAIAAGTYEESLRIPSGVTLVGACTGGTTIAPTLATATAVFPLGPGVRVENLSVVGPGGGALIESGRTLTLRDVVVRNASGVGLHVNGGELVLDDVVVRDVTTRGALFGRGIDVEAAGRLTATNLAVIDVGELGIRVADGATATVARGLIRRVGAGGDGLLGRGVEVIGGGASFGATSLVVEDVRDAGLAAFDGSISLEDSIVRRVAPNLDGSFGTGIDAVDGSSLTLRRVRIEDVNEGGVTADRGSEAELFDVTIHGVRNIGAPAAALAVQRATMTAERVRMTDIDDVGALVLGVDARVSLRDIRIADVVGSDDGTGPGINAYGGATLTLERASIERVKVAGLLLLGGATVTASDLAVREVAEGGTPVGRCIEASDRVGLTVSRMSCDVATVTGLVVSGTGTNAMLSDLTVTATRPNGLGLQGRGIEAQQGANVVVERILLAENREVGVLASDEGTTMTLNDAHIEDMRGREASGDLGRGIQVQQGAVLTGQRIVIARSREVGMLTVNGGAAILEDLVIEDTRASECAETTCIGRGGGTGINVQRNGIVALMRFSIRDNPLAGLQIVAGEVDISNGEVARNTIGVNLQNPDFDIGRLMNDVVYVDNGINLDTSSLPIPDAMID